MPKFARNIYRNIDPPEKRGPSGFLSTCLFLQRSPDFSNAPAWLKDNCSQDGGESKGDFV
jgi:hypothetical protein